MLWFAYELSLYGKVRYGDRSSKLDAANLHSSHYPVKECAQALSAGLGHNP